MKACKGLEGVPEEPVSPLEVAHDRWEGGTFRLLRNFRPFEFEKEKGNQHLIPLR